MLLLLALQTGLIGARLAGAKAATGGMLVFLDSHCEATPGNLGSFRSPVCAFDVIIVTVQDGTHTATLNV